MGALLTIGVLFLGAGVFLLVRAVALPRVRMAAHLRQIDTYGFTSRAEGTIVRPPLGETINGVAEGTGRFMLAHASTLSPLPRRELASAGFYTISLEAFHGYRALASLLLPAIVIFESAATGGSIALGLLLSIVAAGGCWVLFGAVVRHRSDIRLNLINRELPELIDVLIATIEAGLGFAGSLQLVARRFDGPLGSELKLALQEQSMGLSTEQALSHIVDRSDTPATRAFVRAVSQGESLGISIGAMMRNLALEMRTRRRQAAQERAQKAPVKMLFPLIILIFPAMLIVLLYPAVHQLLSGFASI
jgi:pilus assembly protein TadC